ncbi:MAG: hypothetical protein QOH97_3288 [Actinoplanes sp.]|jgi:hypothetical protein|nr:hypothetical protein [Actinoplanes sp.]
MTDVVLPCLHEAPALAWLLARMPAGSGYRAIMADNGSTDAARPAGRHLARLAIAQHDRADRARHRPHPRRDDLLALDRLGDAVPRLVPSGMPA